MARSMGVGRRLRGVLARQSTQGLVSGAGKAAQRGQNVGEGVAREELGKDVAKGFGWPTLALGPGLSVSTRRS